MQSSTRNLDVAMQGQSVNPMAPGYSHDEESQILLWASQSMTPLKFKTFKLGHRSHALSPVSHLVSEYHLKLLSVLVVRSPPNRMVLLTPLPTVHWYSWLQYHMELLQHRLLLPHPTVGPIAPTEHRVTRILNWLP